MPSRILIASPAEPADLLPDRFRRWFAARGWAPREHQLELLAKARDDRSALLIAPTGAGKTLAGFLPTLVELSAALVASSSSPLPAQRWGGSPGSGEWGVLRAFCSRWVCGVAPPPRPLPATRGARGGGEGRTLALAASSCAPASVSTGRGVQRSRGLHTLYISPLKALAVDIARNLEAPIAEMGLAIKVETRTGDTPRCRGGNASGAIPRIFFADHAGTAGAAVVIRRRAVPVFVAQTHRCSTNCMRW